MSQQLVTPAAGLNVDHYVRGTFDYNTLKYPVLPEEIQFEGLIDPEELAELYAYMTPTEQMELDRLLMEQEGLSSALLPHQVVPWWQDWWEVMALSGGRGVGKTLTGATACIEHLDAVGRKARVGIGAPTNADVRDVCMEGETGLMTLYGHQFRYYNRSLGEARHKKGGYVKFMGTEKPRRWNGPQWSFLWFDEYALCNPIAIRDAQPALRLGPKSGPWRARMVITFTPKGQKWVEDLLRKKTTYIPRYAGPDGQPRYPTTFDNPHLPPQRVAELKKQFAGTRIGLQELLGLYIGDVPGAKWNRAIIKHETDESKWPRFTRVVVAIDPAGTAARRIADENAATEEERSNQQRRAATSICVKAKGIDGRIYTLAWIAGRWTPNEWATRAVQLFRMFRADRIVAEKNFGGLMVESTLRNVWFDAPITLVNASRGKDVRAEPVVALYEQGREIHCFVFAEAEHQLCAFKDANENQGADYVDSGVWATWELMGFESLGFGAQVVGHHQALDQFVVI